MDILRLSNAGEVVREGVSRMTSHGDSHLFFRSQFFTWEYFLPIKYANATLFVLAIKGHDMQFWVHFKASIDASFRKLDENYQGVIYQGVIYYLKYCKNYRVNRWNLYYINYESANIVIALQWYSTNWHIIVNYFIIRTIVFVSTIFYF